jgi:hypothetical protein
MNHCEKRVQYQRRACGIATVVVYAIGELLCITMCTQAKPSLRSRCSTTGGTILTAPSTADHPLHSNDRRFLEESAGAGYGNTGRGGTGVETISELVVWP